MLWVAFETCICLVFWYMHAFKKIKLISCCFLPAAINEVDGLRHWNVLFLYSWKGGNGFSTRMVPTRVAKPRVICNLGIISVENPLPPKKKSRVAEPRVIFGVPTSENNF
jgi:hypothetical protein